MGDDAAVAEIRQLARPLRSGDDLEALVERVGDARIVLLGEASHGTSDYYRIRADITRRLIEEHGFSFVAVEGDWPACQHVDRYVRGRDGDHRPAQDVLGVFKRWPTWMWANQEVAELISWLRQHNEHRAPAERAAFHGLDVYSLWESLRAVIDHLTEHRPEAVSAALQAWRCFEPYREDPQEYAWSTRLVPEGCEDEVVALLTELRKHEPDDGDPNDRFEAAQNAAVAAGAEHYYRTMVAGSGESWNVRDTHMADTLDRLLEHHGPASKGVVWEHNTHVGDARATDMAAAGMVNVGQLARERHGSDVVLVGFGSHRGTVIAGAQWGAPMERMEVPAAPPGTHEDLLHRAGLDRAVLLFPDDRAGPWLGPRRGHRAIGVVYHPGRDRWGNWVPTEMGRRYDAFIYVDETEALHPLELQHAGAGEKLTEPWGT